MVRHVTPVRRYRYRPANSAPMNTPAAKHTFTPRQTLIMHSLDIHGFTYEQRHGLLPTLTTAFSNCGGWMLERKTLSSSNMEFRIEIQLRAALDLYAAFAAHGVELTRAGHEGLTDLCTRRNHLRSNAEIGQIIAIRLEVTFLDDLTLHSVLVSGSGLA